MSQLRRFIHAELPTATEGMQYGVPVFRNKHGVPVIYLLGTNDHVNFGFLRYDALSDTEGVLQGSGKPSKHVEIRPDQQIDTELLGRFIAQCANLKE